MTAEEEAAFVLARARTGRDAFTLYKKAEGVDGHDATVVAAAAERFRTLPLLLDPVLQNGCLAALTEARGPHVDGSTRFPLTIWGGAFQIENGITYDGTISDFVELLETRAQTIAAKKEGLVVEPTTTTDGQRTNENTTAVHALFLDCDGAGNWEPLLAVLRGLGYCHIAYQSGGWSPSCPKWRVVLPLSSPHDTSTEAGLVAWKVFYRHARTALGAVGKLLGVGFDAATDTPCCPWFLTERRSPDDLPRQIIWQPGHSLDSVALALALPPTEEIAPSIAQVRRQTATALANDRLEEIVTALAEVTASIPTNRRDLYLALPGVLLDRGLEPDDVYVVCEAVSERYPRSHPDKHADNLHCAKTTIGKWERDDRVTRIGTLNEIAPQIARVIDEVLPDPDRIEFVELARRLARRDACAPPPPPSIQDSVDEPLWTTPVDLKMLRSLAVKIRRKKRTDVKKAQEAETDATKETVHYLLLERLLDKKPLAFPLDCDCETQLNREDALYKLMGLLAFRFPKNTPVEIVIELLRPSIFHTLEPGESADKWLKMAQRWYVLSLAARLEMDAKKAAEHEANLKISLAYVARGRAL